MVLKIRGTDGAWTYYGEVTSLTASESGSWVKGVQEATTTRFSPSSFTC